MHVWIIPCLAAGVWWGMVIALLVLWKNGSLEDSYYYEQNVKWYHTSTVMNRHLALSISCSAVSTVLLSLSSIIEVSLREARRIPGSKRTQMVAHFVVACMLLGQTAIIFAVIWHFVDQEAAAYYWFLGCSFALVGVSALLSIIEYACFYAEFPGDWNIRISLAARSIWFLAGLILAAMYGSKVTITYRDEVVLEWVLVFVYPVYMLVMALDLWPAHNKKQYLTNKECMDVTDEVNDANSALVEQFSGPHVQETSSATKSPRDVNVSVI